MHSMAHDETNSGSHARQDWIPLTPSACQNCGHNYEIGGKVGVASGEVESVLAEFHDPSCRVRHEFRPQTMLASIHPPHSPSGQNCGWMAIPLTPSNSIKQRKVLQNAAGQGRARRGPNSISFLLTLPPLAVGVSVVCTVSNTCTRFTDWWSAHSYKRSPVRFSRPCLPNKIVDIIISYVMVWKWKSLYQSIQLNPNYVV